MANVRNSREEGGGTEGEREGKWDTHATASTGCPRTDPAFNINDGHVDENGVGVSRGGCFAGGHYP